jgi:hypothetical protein
MFSKSRKVGSPADREMSIPRANEISEAVTVVEAGKAFAAGREVGRGVGSVAGPDTEQNTRQIAVQMRIECL